jgi:putative N6-adenine-specific DNA methylase
VVKDRMPDSHEFFLVTLPGLEDLVQNELKDWYPNLESKKQYGGVSVHTTLAQGLALNRCLKIPTRILVRLEHFRCRDFPKLYNRMASFDWSKWLDKGCTLEVFAATKKSRLKIKTRIEETCVDGFNTWTQENGIKPNPKKTAKLYIRIIDDELTMSLDTSGERLHKRGTRVNVGEAPLRETIAASLLQLLSQHGGRQAEVALLDPMLGSGTFLIEALERDQLVDAREFGFESFRKDVEVEEPHLASKRTQYVELTGLEQDSKTLQAAKKNLSGFRDHKLHLNNGDIFSSTPLPPHPMRWVVCNPPYGERLKVDVPLMDYYANLFAAVENMAQPKLSCFLLPAKAIKGRLRLPPTWKALEKRPFLNGGIAVVAFVFGRVSTP